MSTVAIPPEKASRDTKSDRTLVEQLRKTIDELIAETRTRRVSFRGLWRVNRARPPERGWVNTHTEVELAEDDYGPIVREACHLLGERYGPPPVLAPPYSTAFDRLEAWLLGIRYRHEQQENIAARQLPEAAAVQAPYFPNPSAPMSKKDAADAWGGSMQVRKLTELMQSGKVRYSQLTRQQFIFSRDDIPNLPRR